MLLMQTVRLDASRTRDTAGKETPTQQVPSSVKTTINNKLERNFGKRTAVKQPHQINRTKIDNGMVQGEKANPAANSDVT